MTGNAVLAGAARAGSMVVSCVSVLLPGAGSAVDDVTEAVFVSVPVASDATLTVSVYCWLAPLASVARAGHVTVWPTTEAGAGVADW